MTPPRPRSLIPAALAALALGACNAIFGIVPGEATSATGSGGSTSSSSGSSTGDTTSTSTTSTGSGSSSGSGPACGADAGTPKGTASALTVSATLDDDAANGAAWDGAGNLVVAGFFAGSELDLGGPGNAIAHGGPAEIQNAYVAKLDGNHKYLWGKGFGGTANVRANGVAVDGAGNILVTGTFDDTVQIGATKLDAMAIPMSGYSDLFVAKLDPSGNVIWAKHFGNPYIQRGLRIATDSAGNAYIAGVSFDKVDFGNGKGLVGDEGSWWSFVLQVDPTGKPGWVVPFSNWDSDVTPDYSEYFEIAVTVDLHDHVIAGGNFKGQDFFGSDLVPPFGETDAFVVQIQNTTGEVLWHRFFHQQGDTDAGLDGKQWVTALAADPCTGDVYAAGGFTEGIQFEGLTGAKVTAGSPKDPDMFLVKLAEKDGQPLWAKTYGDAGSQEATSLTVDPDGDVLMAGFLLDAPGSKGVDFGSPIGTLKSALPEPGPDFYADAFLIKLGPDGAGHWGKRLGDDHTQRGYSVIAGKTAKIALAGAFGGTMAVGGGVPPYSAMDWDSFIAWFEP
jgi:hypothetical protein